MENRPIERRGFLGLMTGVGMTLSAAMGRLNAEEIKVDTGDHEILRNKLLECLGGPWPEPCPRKPKIRETIQKDGYRIESLTYEVEPGDRVPAILLVPDGVDTNHPVPAIVAWHQHAGQWNLGKSELAGLAGDPMHHTGAALAKEGYVVLCPDALCFEERQDPTGILKGGDFERFEFLRYLVSGKCLAWKKILDMKRAVDYLCSRPEVQQDRIGCYGHSMGSTSVWLVGPWEPRFKALVGNCCLPTIEGIHKHHLIHCFTNYIPGFDQYGDHPEIAALIAPRALHLNLGETDQGSPIMEARAGCERIAAVYAKQNVSGNFRYFIEADTGHVLSPAMWEQTLEWFSRL